MSKTRRPNSTGSELALTFSGILVTAVVGAVGAWTVFSTPWFIPSLVLAAAQLTLVIYFMLVDPPKYPQLIFWLEAVCIGALLFLIPSTFLLILSMVWLVQAVELFGSRKATQLLVASLVLFVLAQYTHLEYTNWSQILISMFLYGLLQVFAISVTQRVINERNQREQLAVLNRELLATRQLLSQSAAQNERLRIARDLHDILGHHMTALILNLEVASHVAQGQPKEKVEQSLALAKLLLSELRSTVSDLRDDSSIDLEESIKNLVADIPNLSIDVDFSNAPAIDDIELAETLLRCTQEAVTNVLRHSDADHCRISVSGDGESWTLSVCDNGTGKPPIEPGNGLKGMRERVTAKGGELHWQQYDNGFELRVLLRAKKAP